ncbi:MAG: 50S ribosomal protein L10 [Chloroflexi bacterium]|nr:MAG: 50S ribosomal protein L10 [Chloroflexota bacterium]
MRLAISKQRKIELVAEYTEQLEQSQGIILADYRGLSVNDINDIRRAMRPIGGKFRVVKNRLLILALEEMGISLPSEWLIGPTVVSFCQNEVPPVAKTLTNAAKKLKTLRIKGGVLDRSVIKTAQVRTIANLPSREVLFGQALGVINAPATQVAGVVAGGIRQVLNVLQAYVDKLQESGPDAKLEQAAEPA